MLDQSAILLAAAVVAVLVFQRLGLGTVLGYLAAGIVIGPAGLGLIGHVEQILPLAEFGVVLLLFLIGLELEPERLWKLRGTVFGLGSAQVALSAFAIGVPVLLLGADPKTALIAGLGLSLSSTAFVLQLLAEKNELATPHGRAAFGILLFQDLAAIPMLALIPLLGTHEEAPHGPAHVRVALLVGAVALVVIAGRYVVRPIFRLVASTRSRELSTATALLVVVATALLMESVELSMALGAFLAGMLLAGSEYRHELEADIEPFKGLLLGLFFIAVGMQADLHLVAEMPLAVIGAIAALVAIKFAVVWGVGRVFKKREISCICLAVALSQGGEFAFVLFAVAAAAGAIDGRTAGFLALVVTGSMATTPILFALRDRWLARRVGREGARDFDAIEPQGPVIIAGFGRFGQIVSRVLRSQRIHFTALEASPAQVDFVRRFGNRIYYGDASRPDLLRAAGAANARAFVLAIDHPEDSVRTAQTVRQHFPELPIVARARNRDHALALRALGIETVIRETYGSSLEAAEATLASLGLDLGDAREATRRFREHDERLLEEQFELRGNPEALIASSRKAAEELERLFEQDRKSAS